MHFGLRIQRWLGIPPVTQQVPGLMIVAAIIITVLGALWLAGPTA